MMDDRQSRMLHWVCIHVYIVIVHRVISLDFARAMCQRLNRSFSASDCKILIKPPCWPSRCVKLHMDVFWHERPSTPCLHVVPANVSYFSILRHFVKWSPV